jgi:hypothetical protein
MSFFNWVLQTAFFTFAYIRIYDARQAGVYESKWGAKAGGQPRGQPHQNAQSPEARRPVHGELRSPKAT